MTIHNWLSETIVALKHSEGTDVYDSELGTKVSLTNEEAVELREWLKDNYD